MTAVHLESNAALLTYFLQVSLHCRIDVLFTLHIRSRQFCCRVQASSLRLCLFCCWPRGIVAGWGQRMALDNACVLCSFYEEFHNNIGSICTRYDPQKSGCGSVSASEWSLLYTLFSTSYTIRGYSITIYELVSECIGTWCHRQLKGSSAAHVKPYRSTPSYFLIEKVS